MKYVDLAHDIAELFDEAQHLSQRPAWVSVLDWASIRKTHPSGMSGRAEAFGDVSHPPPPPPPSEARARVSRRRVPVASPVTLRLVVRTAPEVLAAAEVGGPRPTVTRLPCTVCGGVVELREGSDRLFHLRAPGGCRVGILRKAVGA